MADRDISEADARRVVKAALRRAARQSGGQKVLALDMEVSEPQLSNLVNTARREMIGAHQVLLIDQLVGSPVMLETLAREAGFLLVKNSRSEPGEIDILDLLRFVSKSSDVSKTLGESLEDGIVDAAEARELEAKIDRLIALCHDARDKIVGGRR